MKKYIDMILRFFRSGTIINFGTSKAKLIKENSEFSTIFEEKFIKFLNDNKEELSYCLYKYELSNYNRLDGLIDLINLMKNRIKK